MIYRSDANIYTHIWYVQWAGHVARMGEKKRNVCRLSVGKPEGKTARKTKT
jgi:hypothetical protein